MAQAGIRHGLRLLAQPDFARLAVAFAITYTGNAMAPIAVAFGVLELTGSTADSAIVIAAPVTAQIVILLVGGALADRYSRQRQIVFAEWLAGASQLVVAVLFLTGTATVAVLVPLMLVVGAAFALEMPARTGFIPQVVARADLQAANALLGATRSAATTLGAALAGIMVALFGAGLTIALDALSFAIAGALVWRIRANPQAATQRATLWHDLRLGWREFTAHQWLWAIVLQFTVLVAAMEAVNGLLGPAVARDALGGSIAWGFIAASTGVGTVVGGLIALRVDVERPMWVASWCVFPFAGTALALAGPAPLVAIVAAAFVGGMAMQTFSVLWYTTLQTEVPAHMLSRVSAYDHMGSLALAPLGIVVGGFLFEAIGARPTLLIAAAAVIVPTACVLFVPGVRSLQRRPPV
jgi:predicted MFS family arabinose efflux permease